MQSIYKILSFYWAVLQQSIVKFVSDDMPTRAAALSYYMIFSLPPMLLIILWATGRFYRELVVREAIFEEIGDLVGEEGALQLMLTIEKLSIHESSFLTMFIGLMVLCFFATSVFVAMSAALNQIMKVKGAVSLGLGIRRFFRARFAAFAMLVSISFILLVSLVVDVLIAAIGDFLMTWLGTAGRLVVIFDYMLLDLLSTTALFALYFRYLPDIRLAWVDIWFGALLTAVLITVGQYFIAFLIANSEVADLYDAAGSILVIMLWVYYAAAIFLFGAVFTFTRATLMNKAGRS